MRLIILGAGGYGRTVADIASQLGYETAFLDDRAENAIDTCERFERYRTADTCFYPAFGSNETRVKWIGRLEESGCTVATLIHPRAYVSPTAVIDTGCVILPLAAVGTAAVLKKGCIINLGAVVDHDCVLEEGVHAAPGAVIKADNHIPACMKIESGQVIQNGCYR